MCVYHTVFRRDTLFTKNLRQSALLELHVLIRDGWTGVGGSKNHPPSPPPTQLKQELFCGLKVFMTVSVWPEWTKLQYQENCFFSLLC